MAWIFYVQRDYPKAQPLFEKAVELETDKGRLATYHHALGWIFVNTKQPDRARDQFRQALGLNPDLQGAKDGLALLDKR